MGAKAYLIAEVEVTDVAGYENYRAHTGSVIERFGGRFLIRGGTLHPLEGDLDFSRFVVIEFPDLDSAQSFYHSPEYQALLPHRTENATSTLFIAEGAAQ